MAPTTQAILPKIAQAKVSKETCHLIFVCHKKGVLGKHPIRENNTYVCFH